MKMKYLQPPLVPKRHAWVVGLTLSLLVLAGSTLLVNSQPPVANATGSATSSDGASLTPQIGSQAALNNNEVAVIVTWSCVLPPGATQQFLEIAVQLSQQNGSATTSAAAGPQQEDSTCNGMTTTDNVLVPQPTGGQPFQAGTADVSATVTLAYYDSSYYDLLMLPASIPDETITIISGLVVSSLPQPAPLQLGGTYTATGTITDPGATSWTETVDYGDNKTPPVSTSLFSPTFTLQHEYDDPGSFTVTVTISDNSGASARVTTTVTVNDMPPDVTIDAQTLTAVNVATFFFGNFTAAYDDATLTTYTVKWDWADGTTSPESPNTYENIPPTFYLDVIYHKFAKPGSYLVQLIVSDGHVNGTGSASDEVIVWPAGGSAGANLTSTYFLYANLPGVNLGGSNLHLAVFDHATLQNANLQGVNASQASFQYADLTGANLSGGNFSNANLSGANLSGANLSGANLSGADLSGADLQGANLSGVTLSGANLQGTNLTGLNLSGLNLSGANLQGDNLQGINLSGANLKGANLKGADLSGANLKGANLKGATVTGIIWSNTTCPDGTNSTTDGGTCTGHGGGL